jgi:hypothetical protein
VQASALTKENKGRPIDAELREVRTLADAAIKPWRKLSDHSRNQEMKWVELLIKILLINR